MRKVFLMFLLVMFVSSCTNHVIEAGKVKKERKELYDYKNNDDFCKKNPNKCVNNIPWM